MLGKIIDAHAHLSARGEDVLIPYAKMNGLRYTLDELLRTMRSQGVRKSLLLTSRSKDGTLIPNTEVIKLCRKSDGMLQPVVTVEPKVGDVKIAVNLADENPREVKAFKIMLGYTKASPNNPVFNSLYDYAESEDLPVLFHTGDTAISTGTLADSHPLSLDSLANKREELKIVLCHFGNPWFMDAAELVYKHSNVYADISGLVTGVKTYKKDYEAWLARNISEAIYYIGDAKKVLFGTDYPVSRHADALSLVRGLKISKRDRERILGENAEQLFHL